MHSKVQLANIILVHPKCKIIFGAFKFSIFPILQQLYWTFSIVPLIVIALPTLRQQQLSLLMLFCLIFYFDHCLIFCVGALLLFQIFLSLVIALPTIAIAIVVALSQKQKVKKNSSLWPSRASKIDNYSYCDSWKSNNFTESNTEKKQRTNTKNEAMTKIKK